MSDAIGALNARIRLQSLTRVADEIGGAALAWLDEGEVWAEIEALGASQAAAFDAAPSTASFRVTLRSRADVRAGWRLVWGVRLLRIVGVRDDGGALIELQCEEEKL